MFYVFSSTPIAFADDGAIISNFKLTKDISTDGVVTYNYQFKAEQDISSPQIDFSFSDDGDDTGAVNWSDLTSSVKVGGESVTTQLSNVDNGYSRSATLVIPRTVPAGSVISFSVSQEFLRGISAYEFTANSTVSFGGDTASTQNKFQIDTVVNFTNKSGITPETNPDEDSWPDSVPVNDTSDYSVIIENEKGKTVYGGTFTDGLIDSKVSTVKNTYDANGVLIASEPQGGSDTPEQNVFKTEDGDHFSTGTITTKTNDGFVSLVTSFAGNTTLTYSEVEKPNGYYSLEGSITVAIDETSGEFSIQSDPTKRAYVNGNELHIVYKADGSAVDTDEPGNDNSGEQSSDGNGNTTTDDDGNGNGNGNDNTGADDSTVDDGTGNDGTGTDDSGVVDAGASDDEKDADSGKDADEDSESDDDNAAASSDDEDDNGSSDSAEDTADKESADDMAGKERTDAQTGDFMALGSMIAFALSSGGIVISRRRRG